MSSDQPPSLLAGALYAAVSRLRAPRPLSKAANVAEKLFTHVAQFQAKPGENPASLEKRSRESLLLLLTADLGLLDLSCISSASALFLTSSSSSARHQQPRLSNGRGEGGEEERMVDFSSSSSSSSGREEEEGEFQVEEAGEDDLLELLFKNG